MTFEQVWRLALLELPAVPPLLVRAWTQEAYEKLCDKWGWAFLRAESQIVVNARRTVTATVTQGSATVTSSTNDFLATDAGRQFRLARIPIYTIASVQGVGQLTLDRPYTEESATDTAFVVQDVYITMPADFRRFLAVIDRYNLRPIPFWFSEDQISVADPGRIFTDSYLRYLVARKYSSAVATLGQVQYECWPAPTVFRTYPYLYIRKAGTLADTDVLPGVLFERGDLLKSYVKWQASKWPGTTDLKNPFYQPAVAMSLKAEWEEELQQLQLVDDNEYPQQMAQVDWARRVGALTGTASLLRQTDATLADYY